MSSQNRSMLKYFLDTSALRALSFARLRAASRVAGLLVSPFCFWELLTHLEDEGQFDRIKSHLMKFRHVQVLDDPRAVIERALVRPGDTVHERVEDSDVIYATLAALRASGSVRDMYVKQIRDGKGQVRQIERCVERAREVLAQEERRFKDYLNQVIAALRNGHVSLVTPAEIHQGTLDVIKAWWIQLGDRVDPSDETRERLARREYVYSAYIVRRAIDYVERGALVDPNDFEDAGLCRHLSLDDELVVVTGDGGLRRCLERSFALLNALEDQSCHTKLRVCGLPEFARLAGDIPA